MRNVLSVVCSCAEWNVDGDGTVTNMRRLREEISLPLLTRIIPERTGSRKHDAATGQINPINCWHDSLLPRMCVFGIERTVNQHAAP